MAISKARIHWWNKNLPVYNPWVLLLCRLCHAQHRQEKEVKDKHVAHQSDAHSLRGWHWKGPRGRQESHDESRRAGTHLCRWHYLPCHSTPDISYYILHGRTVEFGSNKYDLNIEAKCPIQGGYTVHCQLKQSNPKKTPCPSIISTATICTLGTK